MKAVDMNAEGKKFIMQNRCFNNCRYFECKPLYGLFAPIHKVTKESVAQSMSPTMGGRATPLSHRTTSHRLCSTPSVTGLNSKSRDLSVSQDSLTSVGSAVSTASRSRVRLGVTSLQGAKSSNQQVFTYVACSQTVVVLFHNIVCDD